MALNDLVDFFVGNGGRRVVLDVHLNWLNIAVCQVWSTNTWVHVQSFHWDSWSDSVDTKALGAMTASVGSSGGKSKAVQGRAKLAGTFSKLNFNLEQFSRRKNRCWSAESGPDWCVPPSLHQDDSNFRDARTVSVSYRQGDKINQVCTATWSLIAKLSPSYSWRDKKKSGESSLFHRVLWQTCN